MFCILGLQFLQLKNKHFKVIQNSGEHQGSCYIGEALEKQKASYENTQKPKGEGEQMTSWAISYGDVTGRQNK